MPTLLNSSRWRYLRWCGASIVLLCLSVMGLGAVYQYLAERRDLQRYPPPGMLVDVGGHRLHITCAGEGTPLVVLEAGLMGASIHWSRVQPGVAQFTRVCAYDRAGNGWSDTGPRPRTPRRIAGELHMLLAGAGLAPPYVLVGHSLGGLHVRVYAGVYPAEVVGMVLVEAQPDALWRWEPKGFVWEAGVRQLDRQAYYKAIQARLGVLRLRGKPNAASLIPLLPPGVRGAATALGLRSQAYDWVLHEGPAVRETGAEVRAAGALLSIPLVVLSAPRLNESGQLLPFDARWQALQAQLARLSPQGTHRIVAQSDHFIHLRQPEAVVEAIRQTVEAVRQQTTKPRP